ncbi:MAG: hypothetical protein ABI346_02955 [Candidatus Baltobacteraceae bacterium]|jgi:hypothetical protein
MNRTFRPLGLAGLVLAGILVGAGLDRSAMAAYAQPNMHAALNSLNSANTYLQRSSTDKAGHRVAALRYVTQAIREVHMGILAGMR